MIVGTEQTVKMTIARPCFRRHSWIEVPLWMPYPNVVIPDVSVCCCGLVRRGLGGFFLYLSPRQNPTRAESWDLRSPVCSYDHPEIQAEDTVDAQTTSP